MRDVSASAVKINAHSFSGEWSLANLPPEGHRDVGPFAYQLFQQAVDDRERQEMPDRFRECYRLAKGMIWNNGMLGNRQQKRTVVNLLIANINRTVANLTAKAPVAEVVSLDGSPTEEEAALTGWQKKWFQSTEQQQILTDSVSNMEWYGTTVEKFVYDRYSATPQTVVLDPFAAFPAPGNWPDFGKCPFFAHAAPMPVALIEQRFGTGKKIEAEDTYSLAGNDREESRPSPAGNSSAMQANLPTGYTANKDIRGNLVDQQALVIELWVQDHSFVWEETPKIFDITSAEPIKMVKVKKYKYPDRIRCITIVNKGEVVLADKKNPNINWAMPVELSSKSWLWGRFPFTNASSNRDTTTHWGYSTTETVQPMLIRINELVARLDSYCRRALLPPLILPQDSGLKRHHIRNSAGLVLQPNSTATSTGIRYLQVPNPPAILLQMLERYLAFFDRISQIEDVDRGVNPSGVIAASAIVALQERGAVLMRGKIRAVDYLVRCRGRAAISFWQNFGTNPETLKVADQALEVQGIQFAGREYNFVVESGSTVAKTSLMVQEQAMQFYTAGAIDRRALLEISNFPGWKEIIERTGETQVQGAIKVLTDAGLPPEAATSIYNFVMQPQGGPGDVASGKAPAPQQVPQAGGQPQARIAA